MNLTQVLALVKVFGVGKDLTAARRLMLYKSPRTLLLLHTYLKYTSQACMHDGWLFSFVA